MDNFNIEDTNEAVKPINKKYPIESSGGINEHNILSYAKCGVNYISIGDLTHSIQNFDLSLTATKTFKLDDLAHKIKTYRFKNLNFYNIFIFFFERISKWISFNNISSAFNFFLLSSIYYCCLYINSIYSN